VGNKRTLCWKKMIKSSQTHHSLYIFWCIIIFIFECPPAATEQNYFHQSIRNLHRPSFSPRPLPNMVISRDFTWLPFCFLHLHVCCRCGSRVMALAVQYMVVKHRVNVRGLPDSPVPPPSLLSFPTTSYFSAIISNLPRCLSTSCDLPKTIADHRDHRRSSQEAALPRTASPGFVIAAFQIWEAWYYTWSLVYTHSTLTKVP
jgi:hypothetical protein